MIFLFLQFLSTKQQKHKHKHKYKKRKHSIRSWRKTSVLRQPIKNRHVENIKSTLKPLSKQTPNRTKEENQLSDKSSRLRLCFLLHHRHIDRRSRTISKNNKFSRALCFLLWGCALCLNTHGSLPPWILGTQVHHPPKPSHSLAKPKGKNECFFTFSSLPSSPIPFSSSKLYSSQNKASMTVAGLSSCWVSSSCRAIFF